MSSVLRAGRDELACEGFVAQLAEVGLLTTMEHQVSHTMWALRLLACVKDLSHSLARVGLLAAMSQKVSHERVQHLWKTCQLCRQSIMSYYKKALGLRNFSKIPKYFYCTASVPGHSKKKIFFPLWKFPTLVKIFLAPVKNKSSVWPSTLVWSSPASRGWLYGPKTLRNGACQDYFFQSGHLETR